jgi:hypothetical protein
LAVTRDHVSEVSLSIAMLLAHPRILLETTRLVALMNPPGNNTFVTWIRSFAVGSDLTGVSAPVSFCSGPSLFRCIVLGSHRCPGVSLHGSHRRSCSDVFDPSDFFTGDELDLIDRISSSHCCLLWVLTNRANAFLVLSSKHLDSLCRAVATDKKQPLARKS